PRVRRPEQSRQEFLACLDPRIPRDPRRVWRTTFDERRVTQPVNSFPPGFAESPFLDRVISYNQVFRTGNPAPESVKSMKKIALPLLVLAFAASAFGGDQDNQAANRVKAASTVL